MRDGLIVMQSTLGSSGPDTQVQTIYHLPLLTYCVSGVFWPKNCDHRIMTRIQLLQDFENHPILIIYQDNVESYFIIILWQHSILSIPLNLRLNWRRIITKSVFCKKGLSFSQLALKKYFQLSTLFFQQVQQNQYFLQNQFLHCLYPSNIPHKNHNSGLTEPKCSRNVGRLISELKPKKKSHI